MKTLMRWLLRKQLPGWALTCLGLLYVLLLGGVDFMTPVQLSFTLFYLIGVAFVAWRGSARSAAALALLSVAAMALDQATSGASRQRDPRLFAWDICSQAVVLCAAGFLVARTAKLTRHLEKLVEQRKSQYETILATAMDGFVAVNQHGRIVDVNESFCRMLGYTRDEMLRRSLVDLEAKEGPEDLKRHMGAILQRGGDRFETRHRHKDGREIDLEISVSFKPESPQLFISFAREIGERKRGEARLRESESRYRGLAEASPDAIFVLDRQLAIRYANSAAATLFNSTAEALLGRSQRDLFSAPVAQRHAELAGAVLTSGEAQKFDERVTFPCGERWIETRLVPVGGADGTVRSLTVICVDISERKRTEFLLREQKELGSILSQTSDLPTALKSLLGVALQFEGIDCGGVYLKDHHTGELNLAAHEGRLTPEFLRIVKQYPANSVRAQIVNQGTPVYGVAEELVVAQEMVPDQNRLRAVAIVPLGYEGTVIGSLNLASHSADSLPLSSRMVIEALASQAAGAIARIRAETERQRLEHEILEVTDREQARIGQEIHDGLCQQLVSLAFDANSLERELSRSRRPEAGVAARLAKYLDQAISEARQLARGLFPTRLESEGLLSALSELARGTRERFGVECAFACEGTAPVNNPATATHLFRIAQEAVSNAIKHAHARSIRILLSTTGVDLSLEIQDDGVGIDGQASRRSRGMGLAIMNYRARTLGARLQLSPGVEGGTRISCCIPPNPTQNFGL